MFFIYLLLLFAHGNTEEHLRVVNLDVAHSEAARVTHLSITRPELDMWRHTQVCMTMLFESRIIPSSLLSFRFSVLSADSRSLACPCFSPQVLSIFFCLNSPQTLYILENILE